MRRWIACVAVVWIACVAVVAAGSLAPPSVAQTVDRLPERDARPASGSVVSPRAAFVTFSLRSAPGQLGGPNVRIATRPTLGADGRLAADFVVSFFRLNLSSAEPGFYSRQARNGFGEWLSTPGTFYWQAQSVGGSGQLLAGPVHRIVVGRGQSGRRPSLSLSRAKSAVVRAVRRGTSRTGVRASCRRPGPGGGSVGPFGYECTAFFRERGQSRRGLVLVGYREGRVVVTNRFG